MIPLAVTSAFLFGLLSASCLFRLWDRKRLRPTSSQTPEITLLVGGLDGLLIRRACKIAVRLRTSSRGAPKARHSEAVAKGISLAGLSGVLDETSFFRARFRSCALSAGLGALVGGFVSNELSALLCAVGAGFGWNGLKRALARESTARCDEVERDLPEMAEVVAMGLRSGMSFDRSLELYCQHFEGGLANAFDAARRRWNMGLATREAALRDVSRVYDSSLLSRMVESTVRALRYGSSLADVLDAFAEEARELRKTRLEESIAKTPVKMMLPIGTLILPAMLMMVLGPVLLELAQGF